MVSKTAAVLLPGNPALAKEFDDLSFKVSRGGKSEWARHRKIFAIVVSILTDSWETRGEHPKDEGGEN